MARTPLALALVVLLPSWLGAGGATELRTPPAVVATSGADSEAWADQIDRWALRGEVTLASARPDGDFPGRRHLRYDQRLRGVRVFGAQLARQVDSTGRTLTVFGHVFPGLELETRPALSPEQAARAAAAAEGPGARAVGPVELVVLPLADRPVLAYVLWTVSRAGLRRGFFDAGSGALLLSWDDLGTASAVGLGTGVWGDTKKVSANDMGTSFRAEDLLRPADLATYDLKSSDSAAAGFYETAAIDPSFLAASPDNVWTDGAVVDAHVYAGYAYDYFFQRHARQGIDGQNRAVKGLVHTTGPLVDFANAFWDPFTGSMTFGDGDMVRFGAFSAGLDVVAHEMTHGVTTHTWGGTYLGETGALNEAFSDIMGTAVEFFFQPPGRGRLMADYFIGEDVALTFDPEHTALRSMANPAQFCKTGIGCDADHYSKRYLGELDRGGIHHNCGIANQAFYLLLEGGTNRTSGITVQGLGASNRNRAEKIFYRGFTAFLTPSATFSDARAATLEAARDLYGDGSPEVVQMAAAWDAVGVR